MLPRAYERIPKDLVQDIFVTDNCSKDDAVGASRALGLPIFRNDRNLGYGGNLKAGLTKAMERGADYAVEVHGDGQFDTDALRQAMPLIDAGTDFIIGSRFAVPGQARLYGMPLSRYLANKGLSALDRAVLGLPFTEFHCGFRVFSRKLLARVPWSAGSDDYLFGFQIIAQVAYMGLSVGEIPIRADYIGDHTSISILRSAKYAAQTTVVLGQFILARLGLPHRLFPVRP